MKPVDDMTPAELDHAVAVEVMGWQLFGRWWRGEQGDTEILKSDFRPASDPTKLHQADEVGRTLGWIDLTIEQNGESSASLHFDGPDESKDYWTNGYGKIPGAAICRAALKAARAKKCQ